LWILITSATDPDPAFRFNADPKPAFHFNADPDPAFHFNADPDPPFHFKMRIQIQLLTLMPIRIQRLLECGSESSFSL
jgi:hypothetical protein